MNQKRYWLRGGIYFGIVGLIFGLLEVFAGLTLGGGISISLGIQIVILFIGVAFIIGAVIGKIYGKIKNHGGSTSVK